MIRFTVAALWLTLPAAIQAATEPAQIFWASDPVRPGETILLIGDGLNTEAVVEMAQVERTEPAAPSWTTVKPLQVGPRSAKAGVPADWKMGVFACRVRCRTNCPSTRPIRGGGKATAVRLRAPAVGCACSASR